MQKSVPRRPLSKSEWALFLTPLAILIMLGIYTVLRPLFPRSLKHNGAIRYIRFSANSEKMAVVSGKETFILSSPSQITLWDVRSQTRLWEKQPGTNMDWPKFSNDGNLVAATIHSKNQINSWNAQTGVLANKIPGAGEVRFVPNHIAIRQNKSIEIRNATGSLEKVFIVNPGHSTGFGHDWRLSSDGSTLVALDASPENPRQNCIKVWNARTGKLLQQLVGGNWNSVEYVNNSFLLATQVEVKEQKFPYPRTLHLLNWKTKQKARVLARGIDERIALSKDKKSLIYFKNSGLVTNGRIEMKNSEISLLSLPDGQQKWKSTGQKEIGYVIADDSMRLLVSYEYSQNRINNFATLWDARSGKVLAEYSDVTCAMISPDGQTVAIGNAKGIVRLYDTSRFLK